MTRAERIEEALRALTDPVCVPHARDCRCHWCGLLRAARAALAAPVEAHGCPSCSGTGKRPVYSAGEEMVAGFVPCPKCQPAPVEPGPTKEGAP